MRCRLRSGSASSLRREGLSARRATSAFARTEPSKITHVPARHTIGVVVFFGAPSGALTAWATALTEATDYIPVYALPSKD
jgi:hypothetical protein